MAKNNGQNKRAAFVGQLLAGVGKRYPDASVKLTIADGVTLTVADLRAALQGLLDDRASVVAARATLKAKVDIERAAQPARNALIKAFVKFLHFTFEHSPEALADFGLTPPKAPRTLTAEEKAVATARREATRAARGTKGPRARQKVKGNVDVNVVVTPQAPAEPATPAAPAQGGGTATQK